MVDLPQNDSFINNIAGKISLINNSWQQVGETPFIITENKKYLLKADGECTYSITSDSVAIIDENTIWDTLRNCTANHDKGYWEIISNDDATSLYSTYAQTTVSGLVVGQEYKLIIDGRGLENNLSTGEPWLGYIQLINSSNTVYAKYQPIYATPNVTYDQVVFVATEETTKVRVQISISSFGKVGGITAHFRKIYINHSDGGNEVTPVINRTGIFTDNIELGILGSNIKITSSPICTVYLSSIEEMHIPKSRHDGKICVCFGDSIVGNMASPNDYPTILGEETGMTVINAGFGGCRMSASMSSTAFNAYSMVKIADAITTGDWTAQDTGLESLDVYYQNKYTPRINALKAINWETVDFITIGYGTNDIANFVEVDNVDNPLDTTTVLGGLRYALTTILTVYPHIKVLILTPIYRYFNNENIDSDEKEWFDNRKFTTWTDGILEVAKEFKVPGVDMYHTLGFNNITRNYYFPSDDGTHPNILGLRVIAEKIAGKLLSEY